MFGKIFESLFTGSMFGAGSPAFAVWSYVIANQKPSRKYGSTIELNPKLLAAVIGEEEDVICNAIKFLCSPDPKSRSKDKQGRRLVQLGEYEFQVVNGARYRATRDHETRKDQVREAVRRHRAAAQGQQLPGEGAAVKALENGNEAEFDRLSEPQSKPVVVVQEQKNAVPAGQKTLSGDPGSTPGGSTKPHWMK